MLTCISGPGSLPLPSPSHSCRDMRDTLAKCTILISDRRATQCCHFIWWTHLQSTVYWRSTERRILCLNSSIGEGTDHIRKGTSLGGWGNWNPFPLDTLTLNKQKSNLLFCYHCSPMTWFTGAVNINAYGASKMLSQPYLKSLYT